MLRYYSAQPKKIPYQYLKKIKLDVDFILLGLKHYIILYVNNFVNKNTCN